VQITEGATSVEENWVRTVRTALPVRTPHASPLDAH
jgi:hypothetical protein